jgi:hypothetical protein
MIISGGERGTPGDAKSKSRSIIDGSAEFDPFMQPDPLGRSKLKFDSLNEIWDLMISLCIPLVLAFNVLLFLKVVYLLKRVDLACTNLNIVASVEIFQVLSIKNSQIRCENQSNLKMKRLIQCLEQLHNNNLCSI